MLETNEYQSVGTRHANDRRSIVHGFVEIAAGATGGSASILVGQPFDTVKTKLQTYPKVYKNVYSCIKKTWQENKIRGLYAGASPALLTATSENAVFFLAFTTCLLYTSPSPRDRQKSRMPSSA